MIKSLLALCALILIGFSSNAQLVAHTSSDRTEKVIVNQTAQPDYDWNEYLSKTLKYPTEAKDKKLQGRVIVEVKVDTDGSFQDVKVVKGAHTSLNEEALRVMKNAPKWKPAMHGEQAIASYLTLPLSFRLQ